MSDLTLEELAELGDYLLDDGPDGVNYERTINHGETRRLLAMARELVRLKSALEFLDNHGAFAKLTKPSAITFATRPAAVLVVAADLGWPDPLPPSERKGEE